MVSQKRRKIRTIATILVFAMSLLAMLQTNWIVELLARRSPDVVYFAETEEPVVALTIDDGPDRDGTPQILEVLRQHDAHATFFLISSHVPGNEEIVLRIVEDEHELANHLTEDEPSILLGPADFEHQLLEAHAVLSEYAEVHWFRPGSGWYNRSMLSILDEHGYRCALGSVYPFDPQLPSFWFATHYILSNVRSGAIIVLHDGGKRGERTAQTLAAVLPELDRRGFRVTTLSDLLDLGE